ncbi:hypothetical protein AN1V17_02330 [Vallitalea sediminicola]
MKNNYYYKQDLDKLEMYQRLIQYWSMIFDKRNCVDVLDNMNYNISMFPEIIKSEEMEQFHKIEPGYTSPDGFTELNILIRDLEYARLTTSGNVQSKEVRELVDKAGIGCGNGCTNVMNGVVNSIIKFRNNNESKTCKDDEVALILPNYTVYTAQLSNLSKNVKPKYVYTQRENNFLPTYKEIVNAISEKTAAVIITYPNNPAQFTYEGESVDELKKIAKYCQKNKVFLVVDNIYQDMLYPRDRKFTEIFNLVDSLDYIIKVYGSSKDTPFYSGYRTGYWFGDPRLLDIYKYYISSTENSLNTYTLSKFSLNMYFKLKCLTNTVPTLEDMHYFSYGVFGWSQTVDQAKLFENITRLNLFEKYKERINKSYDIQEEAIKGVIEYVKDSKVFSDYINQNIGNVFLIKVNAEYFTGTDYEFFDFTFNEVKCGILPGNVFGMPDSENEVWFRITLLHDNIENIIKSLSKIENVLLKQKLAIVT